MNEWQIVGGILTLVTLVTAVVTPIVKLNTTVTRLTTIVDEMYKNFEGLTNKNSEAHGKLWARVDEHDDTLNNHETRICLIERNGKE